MSRFESLTLAALILAMPTLASALTVGFESIDTGSGFENGSGLGGPTTTIPDPFGDGSVNQAQTVNTVQTPVGTVNNTYNRYTNATTGAFAFDSWSGWAFSSVVDTATPGFGNQYAAFAGGGDMSQKYAIAFNSFQGEAAIDLADGFNAPVSMSLTNTTYAALSMRDGDSFAKQFGGPTGNDPDFFSVDIIGLASGGEVTGSITFFLADYRSPDNSLDYIVDTWETVDLTPLGTNVNRIEFALNSSDVGQFGINTPTYFAMDNFAAVPEPSAIALLGLGVGAVLVFLRRRSLS